MMAHVFNANIQEAEVGESWDGGQPGLYSKTLPQEKKNNPQWAAFFFFLLFCTKVFVHMLIVVPYLETIHVLHELIPWWKGKKACTWDFSNPFYLCMDFSLTIIVLMSLMPLVGPDLHLASLFFVPFNTLFLMVGSFSFCMSAKKIFISLLFLKDIFTKNRTLG
jgi:hypothetical protein